MRVTQQARTSAAVRSLRENQATLEKLRLQIATGRKILEPADDPQGTERSITLRTYYNTVETNLRNMDTSEDWMEASAAALGDFGKVLDKMRVLALQGANDTWSANERQSMAVEVREALSQALDIANTDHNGQRLFAGFKVTTQPFQLNTTTLAVTYNGSDDAIRHEVEPGSTIQVNVAGSHPLFQTGFGALKQLYNGLMGNDTDAIRSAMDGLDRGSHDAVKQASTLGSRLRALDDTRDRLEKFKLSLESQVTNIEGVDVPQAAVYLNAADQQYQATMVNISRDTLRSLFDYLG